MFQIISTMVVELPSFQEELDEISGMPPNVQVQVQVLYFSIYITITNMEGWVLKHCCCNPETRTSTHPTHIHTFTHKHTL